MDYACFGDVLAFDTTYRTNAYKKPLVVLVGVNHHHQTVVFGCALLIDESVGTCERVLETFLEAMMNKRPIFVVTDGDKAMRKAIKKVLPDTCHRLCSWHLQRNAFTNVHIKDFSSIFARCMFMRGNEEEFEKAYLRGNFFGGMRTTQRCKGEFESNNSSPCGAFGRDSSSCIMKRWTKLAKVYTRSITVNETDNNMDRFYAIWFIEFDIAGVQQHEQSMSTPCEGGDLNKYPNEKDMQPFLFLSGVRDGRY
ncbi:hypothetical protein AAG906_022245 [Vitis piasezkii]